jgi:hypothetical protein
MGSAFVLDERELAGAPPRLPAASFELAVPKRGDGDKGVIRKYQLSDGEPLDCEDKVCGGLQHAACSGGCTAHCRSAPPVPSQT